jgi:hypothetical protein
LTGDKIPDFSPDFHNFCEIQGLFPTVRTLTKQKQFSETTTATCVDLISKCTTLVDLDLKGCFYLSPSQVSQLLESLPNLTSYKINQYLTSQKGHNRLHMPLWSLKGHTQLQIRIQ